MTVTHQVAGNVQNGYFVKFNIEQNKLPFCSILAAWEKM